MRDRLAEVVEERRGGGGKKGVRREDERKEAWCEDRNVPRA